MSVFSKYTHAYIQYQFNETIIFQPILTFFKMLKLNTDVKGYGMPRIILHMCLSQPKQITNKWLVSVALCTIVLVYC